VDVRLKCDDDTEGRNDERTLTDHATIFLTIGNHPMGFIWPIRAGRVGRGMWITMTLPTRLEPQHERKLGLVLAIYVKVVGKIIGDNP